MDHFPLLRDVVDHVGRSEKTASPVFHDRISFRKDLVEIPGAGFREKGFDFVERFFRGFDRFSSGENAGRKRREFFEKNGEASFQGCCGIAQFRFTHAFDHRFRRDDERVVAGKVVFPFFGEFQKFFFRFTLQRFFNFVDAGNRRTNSANFALVFISDDFLEDPLDHKER